jgi:hypothetical protein
VYGSDRCRPFHGQYIPSHRIDDRWPVTVSTGGSSLLFSDDIYFHGKESATRQ